MTKKKKLSYRLMLILIYSAFILIGFTLFFAVGFGTDKWFNAWLAFGIFTMIPNVYYMSIKAKKDNQRFHAFRANNGKVITEKPRFIQSVLIALASLCFGPIILTGIVLATLLGAAI